MQVQGELFKRLAGFLYGAQCGLNGPNFSFDEAIRLGKVEGRSDVVYVGALQETFESSSDMKGGPLLV